MVAKRTWTAEQDDAIRALRMEGKSWQQVADVLGMGRNTVLERGRRINAVLGEIEKPALVASSSNPEANRAPLEPGNSITWGMIAPHTSYPTNEGKMTDKTPLFKAEIARGILAVARLAKRNGTAMPHAAAIGHAMNWRRDRTQEALQYLEEDGTIILGPGRVVLEVSSNGTP